MRARAFTLVEMLVVLGIIAILIALLMPAVMATVNRARITRMGTEIAQLKDALEKYKADKGDYPPNLRGNPAAVMNHIRRCYPKIAPAELNLLWDSSTGSVRPAMQLDEGESLVFWLAETRASPQFPFGLAMTGSAPVKYYDFPEPRLVDSDLDGRHSFRPDYAKDTCYLYVDARSYLYLDGAGEWAGYAQHLADPAKPEAPCYAEGDTGNPVLPYWTLERNPMALPLDPNCIKFYPQNQHTYQLICAGQDGDFGYYDATGSPAIDIKGFPGGENYSRGDKDNVTDFSAGKRLQDHTP